MRASLPAVLFAITLLGGLATLAAAFESTPVDSSGALTIASEPPGAEVLMDGRVIGKTPLTQEPSAGSHKLTFRKPGYTTVETAVDWHSQQNQRFHQRLKAQPASLRIKEPGQAKFRLGPGVGRALEGKGPWKLPPGQYELTAVRDKIPAKPKRFELKPGQSLEIAIDWPSLPALPVAPARPPRLQTPPPSPPNRPTWVAPAPPRPLPRYNTYQAPRPVFRPPARPAEPLFTPIPPSHSEPPPAPPSYNPGGPEPVFTPLP